VASTCWYVLLIQAYSKDELARRQSTFSLFERDFWIFRHSFLVYALAQIYLFLSNTMYVTELIETFPCIRSIIQNQLPSGEVATSRAKLVLLRCLLWTTTCLLSLMSNQVLKVLDFGGNVCSPLISVILPVPAANQVSLYYAYLLRFRYSKRPSFGRKILDTIVFIIGVVVLVWGTRSAIDDWGEEET